MILIILSTLFIIVAAGITTIPFSIGLLTITTVLFKKPRVLFLALGLGLFLDLSLIRPFGYTSLIFVIFVFLVFLYERKFETRTLTFVAISTFLGSIFYLWLFKYQMVFLQAFVNAVISVLIFRFFVILSEAKDLDSSSLHSSE